MRPNGHARIDARSPRAKAVCDRCGAVYNHYDLNWQFDWVGPRLQNLRILVCKPCLDTPQENLRTIVLPQDPVPISNPRPELYVADNNPLSPLGGSPNYLLPASLNADIGSMQNLPFAFDASTVKPFRLSAGIAVSNSSFNTVGKNWNAYPSGISVSAPSSNVVTHSVSSFTATAPTDMTFLVGQATSYFFQGSSDGVNWTTLSSGTTAGVAGESITAAPSGGSYQYHRLAILGDGLHAVGVAQLSISVSGGAQGSIGQ